MSFISRLFNYISSNNTILLRNNRNNIRNILYNINNDKFLDLNISDNIYRSLSDKHCGVHLLHNIDNINTIYHSLSRLYNNGIISGFLYVPCERITNNQYLHQQLNNLIGIKSEILFSHYLEYQKDKIVLFLDNIDHLYKIIDDKKLLESFIVSLAEDSILTKKYTCLITTNSTNNYREMLEYNGGCKIKECSRVNLFENGYTYLS